LAPYHENNGNPGNQRHTDADILTGITKLAIGFLQNHSSAFDLEVGQEILQIKYFIFIFPGKSGYHEGRFNLKLVH